MASTSFRDPSDHDYAGSRGACDRLTRDHYWDADSCAHLDIAEYAGEFLPESHEDISTVSGAASIYSTINAHAIWIKAFLDAVNTTDPATVIRPLAIFSSG